MQSTWQSSSEQPAVLSMLATDRAQAPQRGLSERERYEQLVRTAWSNYHQHTRPQVFNKLIAIQAKAHRIAAQMDDHGLLSPEWSRVCEELGQELTSACAGLAESARRLGNLSGQRDYFHQWHTLWLDLLDATGDVLPPTIASVLPPLAEEWQQDSILRRAFMEATSSPTAASVFNHRR